LEDALPFAVAALKDINLTVSSKHVAVKVVESVGASAYRQMGLDKPSLLEMWRKMVTIRRFEEEVEELFLVKKVLSGPAHLYIGQEAIAVGVMSALGGDDIVVSHFRGHGHAIAKGVPPKLIMAELFGKSTGTCRGVGGSMHSAKYPEMNLMFVTAIVGAGIPIATGMALAVKMRGEKRAVATFFGDGAANIGDFHEGTNMAAMWGLPLVLVCENNEYAISMKSSVSAAGGGIARRADAYGMPGILVDGNDVVAVYAAAREAVDNAKQGKGPTLVECKTYRMKGHGVYDRAQYRPPEEVERWKTNDPLEKFRTSLLSGGFATKGELDGVDQEARRTIDEAVEFAERSPMLSLEDLEGLVYG
jgi:pyruvate dehydrogenase E1 component alpha subunit